jgi:hypothetical protein
MTTVSVTVSGIFFFLLYILLISFNIVHW